LVCRKSIIKKLNFKFNKNFEMISDYELCIKLSLVSKVSYVDKILSLPMHYNLKNSEIDYVCENLIKAKNLFR